MNMVWCITLSAIFTSCAIGADNIASPPPLRDLSKKDDDRDWPQFVEPNRRCCSWRLAVATVASAAWIGIATYIVWYNHGRNSRVQSGAAVADMGLQRGQFLVGDGYGHQNDGPPTDD